MVLAIYAYVLTISPSPGLKPPYQGDKSARVKGLATGGQNASAVEATQQQHQRPRMRRSLSSTRIL